MLHAFHHRLTRDAVGGWGNFLVEDKVKSLLVVTSVVALFGILVSSEATAASMPINNLLDTYENTSGQCDACALCLQSNSPPLSIDDIVTVRGDFESVNVAVVNCPVLITGRLKVTLGPINCGHSLKR